jgi:hypothetical protein
VSGGALLLSDEAGVGKTVLLDVAAAHAETAGSRVVRAAGAEFESAVSGQQDSWTSLSLGWITLLLLARNSSMIERSSAPSHWA